MKNYTSILVGFTLFFIAFHVYAGQEKEWQVDYEDRERVMTYRITLPDQINQDSALPVLVCIGGVAMDGEKYVQSATQECLADEWRSFANDHQVAVLGLGFLFEPEDFEAKKSYQFANSWSGSALENLLNALEENYPINKRELYLYGVSGGSQFSLRFAFFKPEWVKAVAAHAAGSYDPPLEHIQTGFLITVGAEDNKDVLRKAMAAEFAQALELFDINHELVVIDGLAHRQTFEQDEMSREYFKKVMDLKGESSSSNMFVSLPMGLSKSDTLDLLAEYQTLTHRFDKENHYMTFTYGPNKDQLLTLHFKENILYNWALNARSEVVDEYLMEFCAGGIIKNYPKTFQAIQKVLNKLPQEAFIKVVNRARPVIFLDVTTSGIARYANAVDFYFREEDPPALSKGFYLIKLGHDLENAEDVQAIEGVLFHEITHHILDHLHSGNISCEIEREANRLVKQWGFEQEFKKASDFFGAKKKSDSPCFEDSKEKPKDI